MSHTVARLTSDSQQSFWFNPLSIRITGIYHHPSKLSRFLKRVYISSLTESTIIPCHVLKKVLIIENIANNTHTSEINLIPQSAVSQ